MKTKLCTEFSFGIQKKATQERIESRWGTTWQGETSWVKRATERDPIDRPANAETPTQAEWNEWVSGWVRDERTGFSCSEADLGLLGSARLQWQCALRWAPHWAVLAVAVGLAVYWSANRPTDRPNDRLEPRICKIQATSVKCCFLMPHFIHWSFQ